jgi:serine/threonine protein phosphatase PrpC
MANKKILLVILFGFSLSKPMQKSALSYGYSLRTNGKGWRESDGSIFWRQEDTVNCCQVNKNALLFCLFDGHGGRETSHSLKEKFHTYFTEVPGTPQQKFGYAFKKASQFVDELEDTETTFHGMMGSTAVMAFLETRPNNDHMLSIAWVGDSRAVLEKKGSVGFATVDHTPHNQEEYDRIIQAGGADNISINKTSGIMRVNGVEVSRAFGDKEIRDNLIISIPQMSPEIPLTPENKLLILASDGIWKVLSNDAAIHIVAEAMMKTSQELEREHPSNPLVRYGQLKDLPDPIDEGGDEYLKLIARALADRAVRQGSEDNISVIVVNLSNFYSQNVIPIPLPVSPVAIQIPLSLKQKIYNNAFLIVGSFSLTAFFAFLCWKYNR